ncbi:PEGA domain-containing protein [Anaerosacchariphilus polymeriproducens]|uniref:PEGA domain-containing protein n=2 Tax=Anaerosacchariphilus polymeriproducens TaxID=1812858 RepID=A0A371AYA5_9FIRM|nr:PEGA domain-containing protein [Anaerosacchariphilus polymeriproducens]
MVLRILLLSMLFVISGCGNYSDNNISKDTKEAQQDESETKDEDISDYYIVISKSETDKVITLSSVTTGQEEIFLYSGTTDIKDKYNEALSMEQINIGEVITIAYEREDDKNYKLTDIKIPKEIWTYDEVSEIQVDELKQMITIGNKKYRYGENLLVLSNGETIKLNEINDLDIMSIKGNGKYVYSIIVSQGHGYIRLKNDDTYLGGWIDAGGKVIQVITDKMLLTVPEGSQKLTVTKDGKSASTDITIKRDEQLVVDIESMQDSITETGRINFKVTPKKAVLTINGKKTDYSEVVELPYGAYSLILKANGYETLSKKLVVQSSFATIELDLNKKEEESNDSNGAASGDSGTGSGTANTTNNSNPTQGSQNAGRSNNPTNSENAEQPNNTSNSEEAKETSYKIYIHGPEDAEVYFDGVYKGIIPVIMEKTTGSHTFSIRKSGYITKSYTVAITDDNEDTNLVFPNLTKETNNTKGNR